MYVCMSSRVCVCVCVHVCQCAVCASRMLCMCTHMRALCVYTHVPLCTCARVLMHVCPCALYVPVCPCAVCSVCVCMCASAMSLCLGCMCASGMLCVCTSEHIDLVVAVCDCTWRAWRAGQMEALSLKHGPLLNVDSQQNQTRSLPSDRRLILIIFILFQSPSDAEIK